MKTDYPDLERLPDTNFWKHLLNVLWNRPRWIMEDIYEKYVLKPKMDKEKEEYDHITRKYELLERIQLLELELADIKFKEKNGSII